MSTDGMKSDKFSELRRRAQHYLSAAAKDEAVMGQDDVRKLVHELDTYQIELELQNEDLRHAQQELERAHQRYTDLYEFAPVAYLTVSAAGLIAEANLTAAEMLGVERAHLLGRPFSAFIVPDDQDIFYFNQQKLRETMEKQSYELRLWKGGGEFFHVQMENVIRPEVDGQKGQFRAMLTDISPLKEAEKKLQEYSDSLEHLVHQRTSELEEEKKKVEVASRAKSVFLATMSHELRTPLNAILGFAFILLNSPDASFTEEQRDYLREIDNSGHHLLAMIQEMLDIARLDRDTEQVRCRPFDLELLLENCFLGQRDKHGKTAMEAVFRMEKPVGTIFADEGKVRQVVENILDNAFKFTPDGGTVSLSAVRKKNGASPWLEIAVADSGPGIAAQDMDRIFLPFEQVNGSYTREFGGIGMGLYKAKKIVELLGGRIEVRSSLGQGSTFTVFLPLEEDHE